MNGMRSLPRYAAGRTSANLIVFARASRCVGVKPAPSMNPSGTGFFMPGTMNASVPSSSVAMWGARSRNCGSMWST